MATKQEVEAAAQALADAQKLVRAQETEIARMRSAGVDTEYAEQLLDALRAGAQSAANIRASLENELARQEPRAKSVEFGENREA